MHATTKIQEVVRPIELMEEGEEGEEKDGEDSAVETPVR